MTSLISLFEIMRVVMCEAKSKGRPDPNIFLLIVASVAAAAAAAAAAVNPNGIKTFLASGLSIFLIKGNQISSNGPESLPNNSRDCLVLCNRV